MNQTHCRPVRRTKKGLSNSREELVSFGPLHPPPEARGRGGVERGKLGPRGGIPYQTANRLPVSNQRLPEILDGWYPLGGSQLETSYPAETQGTHDRRVRGNWGWDHGGDKVHCTWGECTRQAPDCMSCSGGEGTKRRPNRVCTFVEYQKTGTAHNSGPAPCRAVCNLSSVDRPRAGANPVWLEHCKCSAHRPVIFFCSTPPSPQHDWTSEPKQETTSACLCQGRN